MARRPKPAVSIGSLFPHGVYPRRGRTLTRRAPPLQPRERLVAGVYLRRGRTPTAGRAGAPTAGALAPTAGPKGRFSDSSASSWCSDNSSSPSNRVGGLVTAAAYAFFANKERRRKEGGPFPLAPAHPLPPRMVHQEEGYLIAPFDPVLVAELWHGRSLVVPDLVRLQGRASNICCDGNCRTKNLRSSARFKSNCNPVTSTENRAQRSRFLPHVYIPSGQIFLLGSTDAPQNAPGFGEAFSREH